MLSDLNKVIVNCDVFCLSLSVGLFLLFAVIPEDEALVLLLTLWHPRRHCNFMQIVSRVYGPLLVVLWEQMAVVM